MPTYSYRCSACANEFEQFQRFSDEPLTECPLCGGNVRRVIQPVGVVFKGSGWYITDSRPQPSESTNGSAASTTKKSNSDSTESPKSTDAKPDKAPTPA